MAFWSRVRNSQLKLFTTQFRSSYSKTSPTSFLTQLSRNPHLEIPKLPSEFFQHSNVRFFAAPVQVKPKEEKKEKGPRLNEKIPHRVIRVVEQNEEHYVLSRAEALERAKMLNLDLVEVDRHADPPVCRLMDYHKENYVKQMKEKARVKSKVSVKNTCKEVRFSPKCEQKDLVVKANTVKRLMESGYRVKCMATGNEDQDLAELLSRFAPLIEDLSIIESGPIVEKKQAYVVVRHTKFGLKGGKKASRFMGDKINDAPKVTSPKQTPMQFEEHIHPVELEGESDSQVLSDEDDISFPSVHRRERTPSLVSGSSDDFERVYTDDENEAIQSTSYKETKPIDTDQGRFRSLSPPQSQPRHTMNMSPSRLEGSLLKNASPNEVPKLEQPCPDPPKPTPSYGIFSGLGAGNPSRQQGLRNGMNADRNRNPVDYRTGPTSKGASVDKARLGPLPPPQPQPRHNMNVYPSRTGGPALQSVNASPNEVLRQEKPCADPPKSTPSYGIFSGLGVSNPSRQQGLGTGSNANMNRNPVDFRTAPTSEGVSIDKARLWPQSPPQPQPQHKMNVSPSRPERPVFKSVNASPNVVPEQEKSNPPKPTPSYGIFSGLGSSNSSQQQQRGTGMNANMNSNPVGLETHYRSAGAPVDQGRLGQQSLLQTQPRYNLNAFPSRTDGLDFNSKCSPNEVPGQKQQLSDPPKPTPSYGIFSGMKTSNPGKQGLGSEVNASMKRNPVNSQPLPKSSESDSFVSQPDGGQKPSNQGGFGIFSGDSGSLAAPENQANTQR